MKRLLIVVAIDEEMKVLRKALKDKKDTKRELPDKTIVKVSQGTLDGVPVEIMMTSMGMDAADKVSKAYIDPKVHSGVVVLGYCGGLAIPLRVGDMFIATKVISSRDNFVFDMDLSLVDDVGKGLIQEGVKYRSGPQYTSPTVIEQPDEKNKLYETTHAEAVDMETSEVIRAARKAGLPTLAMKVCIDDVETELPHFNDYFEKTKKMDHLNIAQVMMSQPGLSMQLSKNMKLGGGVLLKSFPQVVKVVSRHWNL